MAKVLVIGSGASGVHFALTLLQKGYEVWMLDVGHEGLPPVRPDDGFFDLKKNLSDPVRYFLGQSFEAVIDSEFGSEYYGFPPSKDHVFKSVSGFKYSSKGFSPLFSFAQGGLAETWTGGTYPFNDLELSRFPFSYKEIEPYYEEVARRIGVSGEKDDLSLFMPYHGDILEPLHLDRHSQVLLEKYNTHKDYLNQRLKWYMGRSRVATLTRDKGKRQACQYLGRCLWGCPIGSLYTPSITLEECKKYTNFKYISHVYVKHFQLNRQQKISRVMASSLTRREDYEFDADTVALAAGTLSSSRIYLESIFRKTGEMVTLRGLMDNRQILMPFVNLSLLGERYSPASYQYHQIAVGLEGENPEDYVHGPVTTLKTAMIHPIIQKLPCDFKTGIFLFRNVHAALGLINVNFADIPRENSYVTLKMAGCDRDSHLLIHYVPPDDEKKKIKEACWQIRKGLWRLGCIVPPGMMHVRPMGASVHYAGTIPMSSIPRVHTTSKYGRSHDIENLYFVDGTAYPFLPAKNITFTLMANAIRVADQAF